MKKRFLGFGICVMLFCRWVCRSDTRIASVSKSASMVISVSIIKAYTVRGYFIYAPLDKQGTHMVPGTVFNKGVSRLHGKRQ